MSTAILIPVLNRPHRIEPLVRNITETTPEDHEIYFAVGSQDTETIAEISASGTSMYVDSGDTWPNRINTLFGLTEEPFVFLAADDVLFHRDWLLNALIVMSAVGGVVGVNDLHNPRGTLALVSREYVERWSGCFDIPNVVVYPGYKHNYCDNELFETARSRGKYRYAEHSIVEHLHPVAGKAPTDSTYAKGLSTLAEDKAMFFQRCQNWR